MASRIPQLADVDRDDALRAHGLHHVGRHVVHRATVHQYAPVHLHRRKDERQRHRRPHRLGQRAVIEDDLGSGDQVHGHSPERRRQLVEVLDVVVRRGDAAEEQLDLFAIVQRRWRHDAALDPELQARRIGAGVGLAADVLEVEARGPEDLVPVEAIQHLLEFRGVHARGERSTDEPAHAGPGRDVDRDAVLLEPADDADVRDPTGAAATERHADRRPRDPGRARGRALDVRTGVRVSLSGGRSLQGSGACRRQKGQRREHGGTAPSCAHPKMVAQDPRSQDLKTPRPQDLKTSLRCRRRRHPLLRQLFEGVRELDQSGLAAGGAA